MTIEEIWREMEAEGDTANWRTRYASPSTRDKLLVAMEPVTRSRVLLAPVPVRSLPDRQEWPECQGLYIFAMAINDSPHLGVRLRESSRGDIFSLLTEDLIPRVAVATKPREVATAVLNRLRHWQQFLTARRTALGDEEQRGLWGELHVLSSSLFDSIGEPVAVEGWNASDAAHQDFQFPLGAVEVKTTVAKQPLAVRITSERQLDETGIGRLFLHVVVTDERDVATSDPGTGESLTELIARIRRRLESFPKTLETFDSRLLQRGWLDACGHLHEGRRRTVRTERSYAVLHGFPRLTEGMLPPGVGDVSYALALDSCKSFEIPLPSMLAALNDSSPVTAP